MKHTQRLLSALLVLLLLLAGLPAGAGSLLFQRAAALEEGSPIPAEDPSLGAPKAESVKLEWWITNSPVHGGTVAGATTGSYSKTAGGQTNTVYYTGISSDLSGVSSEAGVAIEGLAPPSQTTRGATEAADLVYWKSMLHSSDQLQTGAANDDETNSGLAFRYLRCWEGQWAVSPDREEWTPFDSGCELVAYYLQTTSATDEVTTLAVDWGVTKSGWSGLNYLSNKYVLVDYSEKYESGEEIPGSFPTEKSLAFHCDVSTQKDGRYYRTLGMTLAKETGQYEVYRITATPSSDNPEDTLALTAATNSAVSYGGSERVVWAESQAELDNSGLAPWSGITGRFSCGIGGEPLVPGLEIYRQQAVKITYYLRARATEDSLTVNYVDLAGGDSFYHYNLAVRPGLTFPADIALPAGGIGDLVNGQITNSLGKSQTLSSDLTTLPALSQAYGDREYRCPLLERSEDGKTLTLYYCFARVILPAETQWLVAGTSDRDILAPGDEAEEAETSLPDAYYQELSQALTKAPCQLLLLPGSPEEGEALLARLGEDPEEELFLAPGTVLCFKVNEDGGMESPEVSLRALVGEAEYRVNGGEACTLTSGVDSFYPADLTEEDLCVIQVTGDGYLSLIGIKLWGSSSSGLSGLTPADVDRIYEILGLMTSGDADGDGRLSLTDVAASFHLVARNEAISDYLVRLLDVNGDGKVNLVDVSMLYAKYTGRLPA